MWSDARPGCGHRGSGAVWRMVEGYGPARGRGVRPGAWSGWLLVYVVGGAVGGLAGHAVGGVPAAGGWPGAEWSGRGSRGIRDEPVGRAAGPGVDADAGASAAPGASASARGTSSPRCALAGRVRLGPWLLRTRGPSVPAPGAFPPVRAGPRGCGASWGRRGRTVRRGARTRSPCVRPGGRAAPSSTSWRTSSRRSARPSRQGLRPQPLRKDRQVPRPQGPTTPQRHPLHTPGGRPPQERPPRRGRPGASPSSIVTRRRAPPHALPRPRQTPLARRQAPSSGPGRAGSGRRPGTRPLAVLRQLTAR